MKKLFIIIIIFISFQSWTKADDIRDFEIQGLSLGDSLLQMYSKKEIKELLKTASNFYPSSKKYLLLATGGKDENFDQLNIDLKYNDKDYIIYGLSQYKRIGYKNCLKEMKIIFKDIKKIFIQGKYKLNEYTNTHPGDTSGNSEYTSTDFDFNNGSSLRIVCTDWGKELEADNYHDNIDVSLASSKFNNWLENEAYK
ncbi:hypothetical protein PQY92_02395 [Candidatus Pelagibacter sp.]|nr:hypothetical protein [Candidatus Pelagibacter sp.]